ncbi:MAG: ATP-binding domain-containing protein [Thermoleophilia bacterium]
MASKARTSLSSRPGATPSAPAAAIDEQPWKDRVRSLRTISHESGSSDGYVGYATIQAFKGLEAPAVLITDISEIDTESMKALLYIGTTRALHRLVMLINSSEMERIKAVRASG